MGDPADAAHLTRLLHDWRDGSPEALDQLMPLVYDGSGVFLVKDKEFS